MTAVVGWSEAPSRGGRFRLGAGRARAALVRAGLLGCSGVIAALAAAAALVPSATAPAPASQAADTLAVPAWISIEHPLQLFALAGSPYARLRLDYQARRRPDGSARQDTLTFGAFAAPAPFLKLSLERSRTGVDAPSDLVVTAARLAGADGIAVVRASQPNDLPSRFGLFAVAPMTLRAGGDEKPCLAFRLEGRPAVAVAGLACGGQGHDPDRTALVCALDRLDLAVAGEDAALRGFFATAERRHEVACAAHP